MGRGLLSVVEREAAVSLFEAGLGSGAAASQLGVRPWSVRRLHERWQVRGREALVAKSTNQRFTFEFRLEVVQRFLAGEAKVDLARELGLSSPKLIENWVRKYRADGADGLKPKPSGRPRATTPASSESAKDREIERLRTEVAYLKKLRALRAQQRR